MDYFKDLQEMALVWIATYGAKLVIGLLIMLVGHFLCRKTANLVRLLLQKKNVDDILIGFAGGTIYYGLMTAVAIAAAGQVGINTTSFLAIAGSVGLAVGLALKGNLSSFTSGVVLFLTRPYTIGDYVTIGGASGTVVALTLYNTILKTPDNQKIIVPNRKVTGDIITNATANPTRRIDLVIGIGYDDDIAKARETIKSVLEGEERLLKEPEPVIAVAELGDSSVNFYVRPWVNTSDYWPTRFSLIENIKLALDANNINIPYPQRDVHIFSENASA